MTADEIIDVFIRSLNLINTDENGLTADNLPVDMEAIGLRPPRWCTSRPVS